MIYDGCITTLLFIALEKVPILGNFKSIVFMFINNPWDRAEEDVFGFCCDDVRVQLCVGGRMGAKTKFPPETAKQKKLKFL